MAAVPDLDLQRIKRFCAEQSPTEFEDQVRVVHEIRGNSVTLSESRPPWDGRGTEWVDVPFVRLRYSPETKRWSLYWADRNRRWHLYDRIRPGTVTSLLDEIDEDPTCIFKG